MGRGVKHGLAEWIATHFLIPQIEMPKERFKKRKNIFARHGEATDAGKRRMFGKEGSGKRNEIE